MSDIAFKVLIGNGYDDVLFKTIMLKGEKGDKGEAGGAEIDDSTISASKTWSSNKINSEISAKPSAFSQLSDVAISNISDGQMAVYNSATGKWKNQNVDASTLKYNSTKSIKAELDAKASSLTDLDDVSITNPQNEQGVIYDATTGKWKNGDIAKFTNTASGSLVHITDGADNIPVKSLVSQIVAVETGNGQPKSPTNPYTISGFDSGIITRCGKNLFNSGLEQGTINSTTGGIISSTTRCVNTNLIPIPQGDSRLSSNKNIYEVAYFDKAKNFITSGYFNTNVAILNTSYAYFRISIRNVDNSTILPSDIEIQLELGNQVSNYEAYNGNTYTFAFGQTIFGGYFNNKGGEIANYGFIEFDGSSDENWQTYPSYNGFYIAINGMNIGTRQFGMCNEFTTTYDSSHTTNSCWFGVNSNRLFLIECASTTGATVEALKTWLASNPLKVFYPLATPRATTEGEGNLVVTHGYAKGFTTSNVGTTPSGLKYCDVSLSGLVRNAIAVSNIYEWKNADTTSADNSFKTFTNVITFYDSRFTDVATANTILADVEVVYPLANPITLAITSQDIPTLLGENNIFSNCGDVEVEYYTSKSNDILEFIDSEIGKKNGTNIPIEENSQDSIKDYIDNEVSTINTSLSSKASKTEDTTITVASGYTLISSCCGKTDRLVHLNFNVEKSGGFATGWQVIGTTDFKPNTLAYCPLWNVTNGLANGEVRIDTDGTINFYVVTAGELRLNANIGYVTD